MADVRWTIVATTSDRVKDLVIRNGQIIYVNGDNPRIAFDYNNKRTFYNQIFELETEQERINLSDPVNGKYYFIIEKAVLWRYFNGWTQITHTPDEILFIGDGNFPELGQPKKIYIDKTKGNEHISIWNEDGEYQVVADKTQTMSVDEINALFA